MELFFSYWTLSWLNALTTYMVIEYCVMAKNWYNCLLVLDQLGSCLMDRKDCLC